EAISHRTMRDQARYVKSLGFSMPQFFLLMRVYYKKQCGISDLSEHMEITAAAASQTVDKLVQLGLLDRAEDPNDRRAKQVTLSASGRELIEKSIAERFRWVDALENSLSAEQKTKIRESLTILMAAADEIDE
ncbi:MAG: MarR family transcriptional regulator, partial [Anaerolineales bacterium]|nr:MarR family transcriptional regulator [Anaerolineales bacterium]